MHKAIPQSMEAWIKFTLLMSCCFGARAADLDDGADAKEFLYQVQVSTGTRLFDGTASRVFMQLYGTEGESDLQELKGSDLGKGTVANYNLTSNTSLGQLWQLRLMLKKRTLQLLYVGWFCAYVEVKTPEGDLDLFPVYRWLDKDEEVITREATAKLIFNDTIPGAKESRTVALDIRRQAFEWSVYLEGLPGTVNATDPVDLPPEVRFSFTKETEVVLTTASALITLGLDGILLTKKPFESIEQISEVFTNKKSTVYEYVEKHWEEDEFFGYQFLNGLNPMTIRRCSELPKNFPVTDEMVKTSLQGESSLTEQMKEGNIFLIDYKELDGLKPNVINDKPQYLTAPLVLLYSTPDKKLMPIAIQLKQQPAEDNPIFLPTDSTYDWLIAKIFVRAADFSKHELNVHLLRTHLLGEVFTVATLRNLPPVHPLYKLLIPHTRYTLQINVVGRDELLSDKGAITLYAGIGGQGMIDYLNRSTSLLTYSSLCMPEDITARGLDSVPNFYYRDDGLRLWDITSNYVKGMVEYYYISDSYVAEDTELQSWIKDIFEKGFLSNTNSGIPQNFSSVDELVKFVTMVMFTVSSQHESINSGQFDFDGWMPNSPIALQLPPPTTKGQSNETIMLLTLPDQNVVAQGLAMVYLLSESTYDTVTLGNYRENYFIEKTPLDKIAEFQNDLKGLEEKINKRNVDLPLPYTALKPENVDNSVTI